MNLYGCAGEYGAERIHADLEGYLFINELVAASSDSSDWIELYNPTDTAIDLSGFYLSDTFSKPLKWAFPDGTIIEKEGFLVVEANNPEAEIQIDFRLDNDEAVILTTPGGTTVIDSVDYLSFHVPEDMSYGRHPDGGAIWMTFPDPTKGKPNKP
ncbi:MAG: lamin tail domain-containing protein [Spirochaetales bacterium]|nr:lamin tail domain-containing protein [Spirochaetales bacterium]